MNDPDRIDHASVKATIESVVTKVLHRHRLYWTDLRSGRITPAVKECMLEITGYSILTQPQMLAAYTNLSYSRISAIMEAKPIES